MSNLLLSTLLWTMNTFGFWANPDGTTFPPSAIGVPRFVQAGKLSCAGRMLDIEHFHGWCMKDGRVVTNQVSDMVNSVAVVEFYDNKPGEIDAGVTWMVAFVEGNPKTVGYQVAINNNGKITMLSGQF